MRFPTSYDDTIDSQSIIAAIKEIESEDDRPLDENDEGEMVDFELETLRALNKEGSSQHPYWAGGLLLINDAYFTDYAEELAYDVGAVQRDTGWPHIDWESAAEDLQVDYIEIDFDGVTFWMHA
jgi:hypothetical protein